MGKEWVQKAISLLDDSLNPIIQELNDLDWKQSLSPNNDKLARHLSAFANLPGGGFMVFGIEDKSGAIIGVSSQDSKNIIEKLGNLGRDAVDPVIRIDHATELYQGKPLLFVHIYESSVKPVHLRSGGIEDSYIRSGGSTRKASRQEIGGLMLNSKTPQFEELHCSSLKRGDEILTALDFSGIYELLDKPIPQDRTEILRFLVSEKLFNQHDKASRLRRDRR
jgi:predicted HTH transcriptional regulator